MPGSYPRYRVVVNKFGRYLPQVRQYLWRRYKTLDSLYSGGATGGVGWQTVEDAKRVCEWHAKPVVLEMTA